MDMERERRWQSEVAVVWQPVRLRLHVSDLCLFCPPEDVMVVQHDTFSLSHSIYSSVCHRRVFRCFRTNVLLVKSFCALCSLMSRERSSTNTVLLCLSVADPATFLASVFWDVIFLWEQLVYLNFSLLKLRSDPLTVLCRAQVLVYLCSELFYSTEGKCVC